jgi:ankyrin repeat protein
MSDDDDAYPLLLALEARQPLEVIRSIVEKFPASIRERASPGLSSSYRWIAVGSTALHLAVLNGVPAEVIRFLYRAWPQALCERDQGGRIPLHHLEGCGGHDGCLEAVSFLVGHWLGSLEQRDGEGRLPVHYAAAAHSSGNSPGTAALRFLLAQYPRSVRIRDNAGKLPLHASGFASVDAVRVLVEGWPASVRERDSRRDDDGGCLPLLVAVREGAPEEVLQFLVDQYPGALLERSHDGSLPIFDAADWGVIELVQFLVRCCPASVRERHRETGRLPVHMAVASKTGHRAVEKSVEIARFLVEAWPESTLERDHRGRTPLHTAVVTF